MLEQRVGRSSVGTEVYSHWCPTLSFAPQRVCTTLLLLWKPRLADLTVAQRHEGVTQAVNVYLVVPIVDAAAMVLSPLSIGSYTDFGWFRPATDVKGRTDVLLRDKKTEGLSYAGPKV